MHRPVLKSKVTLGGFLLLALCFGLYVRRAPAQSGSVQLNFRLTTAAEAALGAPIGYTITITNTSSSTMKLTGKVNLTTPDGSTTYNIWTSTVNQIYSAGSSRTKSGTFTSSTYTSQTGTFTVTGIVTDSTGAAQAQTFPVNIIAVPSNGVYANVGGVGPDTHLLGMRYDFSTVVSNLAGSSMSLKTATTLINPDGTQNVINGGVLTTFAAGASTVAAGTVTSSQYNNQTGTFGLRVDVLDGSNTILASQTHNFVRNPLLTSYYPPTFTDTTASAGINKMNMASMMATCMSMFGQGATAADYDGDGKTDLFVTDGMMGGYLYHNNGDGTFTDKTSTAIPAMALTMAMGAVGANFVDYDNDGHPDIFIVVNGGMNVLLHNKGDGTFEDVSAASGLQGSMMSGYSGATWGDYDGDGYLDVYITNHGDCNHQNSGDLLFHNNGNGTFTNVTSLLQTTGAGVNALGLAALFFDYNGDGRPDLYVGNDVGGQFGANILWQNAGPNGTGGWNNFVDVSKTTNMGIAMSQMGIAIGDYNRDGYYDLFLSNQRNNKLMQGSASGKFTEVAASANVAHATTPANGGTTSSVTWGDVFVDFNNDGWEDLAIGSGSMGAKVAIPNIFYLNNMNGTFLDLSLMSGIQAPAMAARTVIVGDFNGDGFPDLFITAMDDFPHLFVNNARSNGNPYNYLRVKLVGGCMSCTPNSGKSNRDAVGAKLVAMVGGAQLLRTVYNGGTFEGSSDLTVHFGLGLATQVDTLIITWPSGKVQTLTNVAANQVLTITEPM